ncbi:MAG: type II toxin-antitoxin system VapC family toxin [Nitrospira sp. SB0677_bin_15]|nr:type II toxin-antitoxin system VapC family toxin [Nitrospira sp. SB0677_bin_15]MYH02349.1 type II toxin-antitoxin system VapC family toxin [Nitrospira sp. SB0675_bin_23]
MSVAYVDTSALVAVAFNERGAAALAGRLDACSRLLSSNLLEAELRAAFLREGHRFEPRLISGIEWVLPDRPLTHEFERVLQVGYLRGADLWHLATALYLAREPSAISFVTLDNRQRTVSMALGFLV